MLSIILKKITIIFLIIILISLASGCDFLTILNQKQQSNTSPTSEDKQGKPQNLNKQLKEALSGKSKKAKREELIMNGLSKEEFNEIRNKIILETITVSPDRVGFMAFYGTVTNNSKHKINEVKVVVVRLDQTASSYGEAGELGSQIIYDLKPGGQETFNIKTTVEESELRGYQVKIRSIEF